MFIPGKRARRPGTEGEIESPFEDRRFEREEPVREEREVLRFTTRQREVFPAPAAPSDWAGRASVLRPLPPLL
ncbi:MAG: hypothetical protein KDD47_26280 [Acidobacteria bacterium]|nr:hypothetical protein [Acidobacteriota bacterium]